MNDNNSIFKNNEWSIERFKLLQEDKRDSSYREGGILRVIEDEKGIPKVLKLKPAGTDNFITLTTFLHLELSHFEHKDSHIIVAIIGDEPCGLHRLIICFTQNEKGELWFEFKVVPLFDDCVCSEEELQSQQMQYAAVTTANDEKRSVALALNSSSDIRYSPTSGHGIGGGTGEVQILTRN